MYTDKKQSPNVILIYADDLGMGLVSCYGKSIIDTPNIDALANNGMRFRRAYATAFCAPARACLICGIHDAHAGRWSYTQAGLHKKIATGQITDEQASELVMNTGMLSARDQKYLPQVFKEAGYYTGEIGKLEWGFNTCPEEVKAHGWDYHYGYYDHLACHGYYPPFVYENGEKRNIEGNTMANFGVGPYDLTESRDFDMSGRSVHCQDLYDEHMLDFLDQNKDRPFFLYHPSQLPHGPAFYPDIYPQIAERDDLLPVEKEFASMVLRLDETVGKIVNKVEELGLTENTMILFASDNGHTLEAYSYPGRSNPGCDRNGQPVNNRDYPFRTETCGDVFNGNFDMAGLKFSNWDGGCRVPYIVSMPGTIESGVVSDSLISHYDLFATVCELAGVEKPADKDGLSYLDLIRGDKNFVGHDYVVFGSPNGVGIVTKDGWKLRAYAPNLDATVEWQLYNILEDPSEKQDVSTQHPDKLLELQRIALRECDGNPIHGMTQDHTAQYVGITIPPWDEIIKGAV